MPLTETAVQLPAEVYWEFRARIRDAELALVDLQKASAERWRDDEEVLTLLQNRLKDACARRRQIYEEIQREYGLTNGASYRWCDETRSLIERG